MELFKLYEKHGEELGVPVFNPWPAEPGYALPLQTV